MLPQYITKKRIIIAIVSIIAIFILFSFLTKGIASVDNKEGYSITVHKMNETRTFVKEISSGLHFLSNGDYVFTFTQGSNIYTKTVSVKPFFQFSRVGFDIVESKTAKHITANTRGYMHTLGNDIYTYNYKDTSLLRQSYNDPFASNNTRINYHVEDGSCTIIGSLKDNLLCALSYEEFGGYSTIYPIDTAQSKTNGQKRISLENAGTTFKLSANSLLVVNDKQVRQYSSMTDAPVKKAAQHTIARAGSEPLAGVSNETLFYLTGKDFSDVIGDSDNQDELYSDYTVHTLQLKGTVASNFSLKNHPLIASVQPNVSGSLVLLKTINGFTVVDTAGKIKYHALNDVVNSVFWLNDTTIIYQTADGLYSLDTRSWSGAPYFSHPNISLSSASIVSGGIYISGFYKNQESQEQQGFMIDTTQKDSDKIINKLYSYLPKETLDYVITPDQSSIYILSREVLGSSGVPAEGDTESEAKARQYLKVTLPQDLLSMPVVVVR